MQMNLQSQMGISNSMAPVNNAARSSMPNTTTSNNIINSNNNFNDDDNSFLNQDLPNLAAQIQQIEDLPSKDVSPGLPVKRQGSSSQQKKVVGAANTTNTSQFRPYNLNEYKQMKNMV